MLYTNKEIYQNAEKLLNAFNDKKQKLPIKVNFSIQKNLLLLSHLAEEIEASRENIIKSYSENTEEENTYFLTDENKKIVNKELQDLLDIKQEVNILTIKYSDLEKMNIDLTVAQMDAIMFMIEEDNGEEKEE